MELIIRLLGLSCLPVVFMFAWLADDHVLTDGIALGAAFGYMLLAIVLMVLLAYIQSQKLQ